MAEVNLISETYIRENTVFNKNVDAQDIANNIGVSQDMFLEPILGTTFYNSIQLAYSAQTLTPNEIILMGHIKPMLAYRAAEMTLPFLNFNIKNKGIQNQYGDNSAQVDQSTFYYVKKEITNRAEWYEQRLQRYLTLSGYLFTNYVITGNVDLTPDHDSGYDSGFAQYNNGMNGLNRCGSTFNGFFNSNGY